MAFLRRKIGFAYVITILMALPATAIAEAPAPATATRIISGDEMVLNDNRIVKLEGISAPLPVTKTFVNQSRAMLETLTTGKPLTLENVSTDRYGRITAQVFISTEKGRLRLQEMILRAGLAFVYPPTGQETELDKLFAAENVARKAKRGIWADDAYADTPDSEAWQKIGGFAFVSGKVLKAERVKDKIYLNFGDDWKKDFTVTIAVHDLAAFRKAGIDPLTYEGKTIRVRGWVIRDYGPMMTVTAPGQIGIISSP